MDENNKYLQVIREINKNAKVIVARQAAKDAEALKANNKPPSEE